MVYWRYWKLTTEICKLSCCNGLLEVLETNNRIKGIKFLFKVFVILSIIFFCFSFFLCQHKYFYRKRSLCKIDMSHIMRKLQTTKMHINLCIPSDQYLWHIHSLIRCHNSLTATVAHLQSDQGLWCPAARKGQYLYLEFQLSLASVA